MRQGQPPIIDVRSIFTKHYSPFLKWPQFVQRFVSWLLSRLIWQKKINDTMSEIGHLQPFDFIEAAFAELSFTYYFSPQDLENIPAKGGVIIYANHPLGGLDSLSLLHLVSLVRRPVARLSGRASRICCNSLPVMASMRAHNTLVHRSGKEPVLWSDAPRGILALTSVWLLDGWAYPATWSKSTYAMPENK